MSEQRTIRSIRYDMMLENLGMIAASVAFITLLGCIFGAAFMMTVMYFTRQLTTKQPPEPTPAVESIEEETEEDDDRPGLRFVPAVHVRYDNEERY